MWVPSSKKITNISKKPIIYVNQIGGQDELVFDGGSFVLDGGGKIISNLKKMTGKEIQIQSKIEPEIIAGIKVKIGSQMIDASVSTKLNNLKILMKGAN